MRGGPEDVRELLELDSAVRRRWLVPGILVGLALAAVGLACGLGALTAEIAAGDGYAQACAPAGYVVLGALGPLALSWSATWAAYRWHARPRLLRRWARAHGKTDDEIDQAARSIR